MRSSVRNVRLIYAPVVLALLVAACAPNASQNGVNVKTVATNLTYGVPKTAPPAAPANTQVGPPTDLPVLQVPGPFPSSLPPIGPAPSACPQAPLSDFPSAAPANIAGRPVPGRYQWKVDGYQVVAVIGKIPFPTFSPRIVSNVQTTAKGFSFVVQERDLTFGSRVDVSTTYEWHSMKVPGEPVGLYIAKIERKSRTDKTQDSTFTPSPPILFLPTPTQIGATIQSVGIDPTTLAVLSVNGRVLSRKRIDACGQLVDTFYVHSTQTFASGGSSTTREFDYGVATGLGGLPAGEHVESPCVQSTPNAPCQASAVTFLMDAHLAQLKPSPVS